MVPTWIEIVEAPDWAGISWAMEETIAEMLIRTAVLTILDNTDRIKNGVTLEGGKQKQNSFSWANFKRNNALGETPLVFEKKFSDPALWEINGKPARKFVEDFRNRQRRYAARWPTGKGPYLQRTVVQHVTVKLPRDRNEVAIRVSNLGYRVPFGIPAGFEAYLHPILETDLRSYAESVVHGFRSIFAARGR